MARATGLVRFGLSMVFGAVFSLTVFAYGAESSKDRSKLPWEIELEKMTLEQKVGQLMVLGYSGTNLEHSLGGLLKTYHPGGVITFARNIKTLYQIGELNRDAQRLSRQLGDADLLIMVDQEGGSVTRIKTSPPLPSALAFGSTGEAELTKEAGVITGNILRKLGFNMNLAPVFDLGVFSRKNFIGNRAYSSNAEDVRLFADAFSDGLASSMILPTAKHFPGHGGLSDDSHRKTPTKLVSMEELIAGDVKAFQGYLKKDYPTAVMVAHVAFPNIDDSGLPAAFSKTMIDGLLRERLGYDGIVITDDIEMLGADKAGSIGDRAVLAIEAGCDMVMVAWSPARQSAVKSALMRAVRSNRITKARLDQSVARVLRTKARLKSESDPLPPDEFRLALREHTGQLKDLARRVNQANFKKAAARYDEIRNSIPEDRPVWTFSADPGFHQSFQTTVENEAKWMKLSPSTIGRVTVTLNQEPDAVGVFYASGIATSRVLNLMPRSLKSRMIVVNANYPGAIESPQHFLAVIDLNGLDPKSGRWVGETFFAKFKPEAPELREPASNGESRKSRQSHKPENRASLSESGREARHILKLISELFGS